MKELEREPRGNGVELRVRTSAGLLIGCKRRILSVYRNRLVVKER